MRHFIFVILLIQSIFGSMLYAEPADLWVTPIRLDPSGLEVIPGANSLMVINDQGYAEFEKNKPMLQLLRPGFLMSSNLVVKNSGNNHITGDRLPGKKWDGEDVSCTKLADGAIGCALVSGKRDHFVWIVAANAEQAGLGNFDLKRSLNFSKQINSEWPHKKDNPYELETLEVVSQNDNSVEFLAVSRGPADKFDGTGHYFVYKIVLDLNIQPKQYPEEKIEGFSLTKIGEIDNSACPYDPEIERSFVSFMRISALFKSSRSDSGFMVCAHEELSDYSYLVPVNISPSGITVNKAYGTTPIGFSDIVGFKPKVMKVEGLACYNNKLHVAIDADHKDAGVFTLSERFSEICKM